MLESIFKTLTSLVTLQAIIFSLLFILNRKKNNALILLGIFLLAYVGTNILWMLKVTLPSFFHTIRYLPIVFSYGIVPLFFIYTKNVLGRLNKKDFWHLTPALLEFALGFVFLLFPKLGDEFYGIGNKPVLVISMVIIPPVYNAIYAVFTILFIRKQQKIIPNYFTEVEKRRVNWIIITCLIFSLDYVIELVSSIVQLNTDWDLYIYLYEVITTGFIVYWVSIYGLTQKSLLIEFNQIDNIEEINELSLHAALNENTPISEASIQTGVDENYEKIVTFFKETKVYKNKEISLFMVADLLQKP